MPPPDIPGEMRWNLHADRGAALPDLARHFFDIPDFAYDSERFRVDETIEEPTALDRAILVQDRHWHVLDVVIEGVAERDHLDEGWKEHEEQGHRIAQDGDEFLEQDRA